MTEGGLYKLNENITEILTPKEGGKRDAVRERGGHKRNGQSESSE